MSSMLILICILLIIMKGPNSLLWEYGGSIAQCNRVQDKILKAGQELWSETMPLQGGSRLYQLQNLKPNTRYEVKISYPASIPASFSIQLKRDDSHVVLNNNRRLLNTEKLIFKTNGAQDKIHVILVTAEPEGFPAQPYVSERQFIIFNIGEHSLNVSEAVSDSDRKPPKPKRVASLDIFRGLTVALMILVDDAGGQWPMIAHAPWNGCNLADFVMPFFLFIVGMAVPLALKRIPNRLLAVKKVLVRTLKLLFWGLLLQGGFSHAPDNLTYGVDMKHIRWCGILQRIALAYLVVALVKIFSSSAQARDPELAPTQLSIFKLYYWHWVVGACILTVYLAFLYGIYVPDWQFTVHNPDSIYNGTIFTVTCGVRGKLDPPCNAVGYIDREVLGINHMYKRPAWKRSEACTEKSPYEGPFRKNAPSWCYAPFEPEGILSSISAILSTVIGLHFGHVLIHLQDHPSRLKHWLLMGLALLTSGVILHFTQAIPLNKQLYTLSYVCVTSGAAALVFSAFYIMVDIWGLELWFMPLKWIGVNAMFVYVMAAEGIFAGFVNGWYYDDPHNTLVYWIQKHVFINVWHSRRVGILLYVIFAEILFWAVVAGLLHRLGIYWKL